MSRKPPTINQQQLTHVRRDILLGKRCQDFIDRRLTDIYQHAGVRESPGRLELVPLCLRDNTAQRFSAVVTLQHFPVRHGRNPFVVEFKPAGMPVWFDESIVVSTVEVTGVYDDAMKPVLPGFGYIGGLIEEAAEIDFEGEFEVVVDLRWWSETEPTTLRGCSERAP